MRVLVLGRSEYAMATPNRQNMVDFYWMRYSTFQWNTMGWRYNPDLTVHLITHLMRSEILTAIVCDYFDCYTLRSKCFCNDFFVRVNITNFEFL